MGTLSQDLRYAARMLRRSPAFTPAAAHAGRVFGLRKRTSEGDDQTFPLSGPAYKFDRDHNEVFPGLLCRGGAKLALSTESCQWSVVSRPLFVSGDLPLTLKAQDGERELLTTDH